MYIYHGGAYEGRSASRNPWWKGHGRVGDECQEGRWEAAQGIHEEVRGTRVGARAQVSMSSPASSLGDVIAGGSKDNWLGLGLGV